MGSEPIVTATSAVSWNLLALVVGAMFTCTCAVLAAAAYNWRQVSSVEKVSNDRITTLQSAHDQFRVETAENFQKYVSSDTLSRVEQRIEDAIKGLRQEFSSGFDRVIEMMRTIPPSTRKTSK